MHPDSETPFRLPDLPDGIGQIQPFPRPVVWSAALIILLLGVFGLYEGFHGASSRGARGGGDEEEGGSGAVSAQAATPIPANTQWSTLSGPAMIPPTPKASSSAATSSEDEAASEPESEAPSAASAAAQSAPPEAESSEPAEPQLLPGPPPPNPDQQ
ncbi:MAG TPA: hypothetical protein VJP88_03740 [Caulobacteraceae bacterium]|nr:hypothetical protein [Caulobacteraceae bacterium]